VGRFPRYFVRRLIFILPQLLGVLILTFILVRAVPGDPARIIAGPLMSEEGIQLVRERMGLDEPLPVQFGYYVRNVFQGDLGYSWFTGNPVIEDVKIRLPVTLELLALALLVALFVMVPIGIKAASAKKGVVNNIFGKGLFGYGMAAGAFPDFWLGLILIFVFYAVLGWAPAPTGQLDIGLSPPTRITGMYLFDSLVTGNWEVFRSHLTRLILPVLVLAFVYGGGILKVAIVAVRQVRESQFVNFAKVCGLPSGIIENYLSRAVAPAVATITAVMFAFLVGGAVLVEKVFSWNGFGMYAVQSVLNTDYSAVQGVVLVSAVLNLFAYVVVDIVYFVVDPRVKTIA